MSSRGEITDLLQQADRGDQQAANQLFQLVQRELRAIVGRRKQRYANASEASTTAIVDDAFCKLVGRDVTTWQPGDRKKFFSYMANKIHDLLVDAARAQAAGKRGGDRRQIDAEALDLQTPAGRAFDEKEFMLDLKTAMAKMEDFALDECIAFRIRYFLGCTFEEAADILDISATEAKRRFRKAQMWLQRELKDYEPES